MTRSLLISIRLSFYSVSLSHHWKRKNGHISNYPILGKFEDLDIIVENYRVDKVLFSTKSLSYTEIIDTIVNSKSKNVTFGLVPRQ